jgi:N-acetylglucosaminyl-diphospho-decaprenol L-rhamnosyltransferase
VDIAGVIVNYRTPGPAAAAARVALGEMQGLDKPLVIVLDNDSGDGSLERLRVDLTDEIDAGRVVVIDSGHNGGYGFGINVAVRYALGLPDRPRYIHILNPDATVDAGALRRLVAFMDEHPEAGLAGSIVRDISGDVVKAFRFPSVLSELERGAEIGIVTRLLSGYRVPLDPSDVCEVDWVPGTHMLVRSEVFASGVGFDEGYFLYFEEIDFARTVRQAGWKVYFVPDAGVFHEGGMSTGFSDSSRHVPRYWFEARRRYFVKHHGRLYGAAADAAWVCGHAIAKAKEALLRRRSQGLRKPEEGRDFLRYALPNLLKPPPEAEQNAALKNR